MSDQNNTNDTTATATATIAPASEGPDSGSGKQPPPPPYSFEAGTTAGQGNTKRRQQRQSKQPKHQGMHQPQASFEEEHCYNCICCCKPIVYFGAFNCGHCCCGVCAMRIHRFTKSGCPVCRKQEKKLYILQTPPREGTHGTYDPATLPTLAAFFDQYMECSVENIALLDRVDKLHNFYCPMPECWSRDHRQEAFNELKFLHMHLLNDHKLRYCSICLETKPSFLAEQTVYNNNEHDQHMKGSCNKDAPSFQGHPPCLFCKGKRFYDGERLLKHMQHDHYTCDVCNVGEFNFTFYKSRASLLAHFDTCHKLCTHANCMQLDPMLRVFNSEVELAVHMQRQHGVQSKGVSAAALGFNFSWNNSGNTSSSQQAPSAQQQQGTDLPLHLQQQRQQQQLNAGHARVGGAQQASSSSNHTTRIVFDFVTHSDEVNMLPTETRERSRKGKGQQQQQQEGQQQRHEDDLSQQRVTSCVLPPHYAAPLHPVCDEMAVAAAERAAEEEAKKNKQREGFSVITESKHDAKKKAVSETSDSATGGESGGDKGKPAGMFGDDAARMRNPQEMNKLLKQKLERYLDSKQFVAFRDASGEFATGKLLATEYYYRLLKFFTPTQLSDIFEPLAYSLQNELKRDALIAAHKMLSSREEQHRRQIAKEEEERAKREKKNQNAWAGKAKKNTSPTSGAKGGSNPSSPTTSGDNLASSSSNTGSKRGAWGTTTVASPAPEVNTQDFPDLLGGPQRPNSSSAGKKTSSAWTKGSGKTGNAGGGKAGVWFQKNAK